MALSGANKFEKKLVIQSEVLADRAGRECWERGRTIGPDRSQSDYSLNDKEKDGVFQVPTAQLEGLGDHFAEAQFPCEAYFRSHSGQALRPAPDTHLADASRTMPTVKRDEISPKRESGTVSLGP